MTLRYEFATAGERLAYFIDSQLLKSVQWTRLSEKLLVTGRGDELAGFFHEIAVVNTTCRIVRAGASLLKCPTSGNRMETDDPIFEGLLRRYLRERILIPHSKVDQAVRLTSSAVLASRSEISRRTRRRLTAQATAHDLRCYSCNGELDFATQGEYNSFELEHLWPNSFGGNSESDNLLPACHSCNQHKGSFATWGAVAIQSLILHMNPSDDALKIRGDYSFALHYFAARKLLLSNPERTLKWAFQRIGPREKQPRCIDESEIGDFFNLANHRELHTLQ